MASLFTKWLFPVLLCLFASSHGEKLTQEPVIIVSLDGMGWQYISGRVAQTPNLDSVGKSGVKAKYIKTVVPSKTWPNHHTYLTGLYPEIHGIISNTFWDPLYKEKFILDYDCSNYDPKFYNSSEPIWLTLQKKGGRSGVYFWPGWSGYMEKPTYYGKLVCYVNCSAVDSKDLPKMRNRTRAGWPPYIHCAPNNSESFSSRVDKVINWLKSDKPPQFVAFYSYQPDSTAHGFGVDKEYIKEIEKVDKDVVGYLIQSLENADLLDKVNVMFVSDHSFTATSSARQIYLDDFLDSSSYRLIESGVLGDLWPNDGKLEEIYQNLTRTNNSHMKVYKKEDIPERFHWKHNRRIPPIYINPEVGWLVKQSRDKSGKIWSGGGEHGWPPGESKDYSIFFARGPAFREGFEMQPFNTVDMYPLMCHLLGIEPRPNNGSFDNVKAILKDVRTSSAGQQGLSARVFCVVVLTTAVKLGSY